MDFFELNIFNRIVIRKTHDILQQYKDNALIIFKEQVIIQLPSLFITQYFMQNYNQTSLYYSIINCCICGAINTILFTVLHHCMHRFKSLYKFHKLHHIHRQPICISSEFGHPVETIINWTIITWFPCILFPMNDIVMYIYIVLNVLLGIIGHSGYLITFFKQDCLRHYIHHNSFNRNYGFELYDIYMNTNQITI
jgi:sterol desaturase/sphingolipid hydroxylase (fatty acid hydroxylase superfamily)